MLCNGQCFVRNTLSIKAGFQGVSALKMSSLLMVILMVRPTLPVQPELIAHISDLALRLNKTQGLAEGRGSFFIFSHDDFPFNHFFCQEI